MKMRDAVLSFLGCASFAFVVFGAGALTVFLFMRGLPALDLRLFFDDTPPLQAIFAMRPVWDGIWPAMAGTLSLLVVTMLLALPLGVSCGVYLACFASAREREWIGECVDVLAGIPSIVMGLFGLELIVVLRRTVLPQGTTCLLLASVCLALLVLPTLIAATRASLEALPARLSLTADALGLTKVQTVRHLLLPAAGPGILGGVVLAMGRATEDTAVIMLTGAVANAGLPAGLTAKFEALPFKIFYTAAQYTGPEELARGFGTALFLLLLSESLIVCAKLLQQRLLRRWSRA